MRCDVASPGLTTTLSILVARDHFQLSRNMAVPLIKFSGVCPHSDLRVDTFGGEPCRLEVKDKNKGRKDEHMMKIATWNVNTMNKEGKLENLTREMRKNNIDLMGLGEVRWIGEGELIVDEYKMVYKGGEKKKEFGVGIIYKQSLDKNVTKIIPKSDRVIAMKITSDPVDTLIIQVYMPTSNATDDFVDEIYKQIEEVIEENGKGQIKTIIMGDWNSVVGDQSMEGIVGKYGYGKRNERGEKLIEFCKQFDLWISNTWFKQHKRRLYTWKNPGDRMRFQIDYILINQRFKNSINNVKTYPGADIFSDHNLLLAEVRTKLKRVDRKKKTKKWDTAKLKTDEGRIFEGNVEEALRKIVVNENIKDEWNTIKNSIVEALEVTVGKQSKNARKEWVTQDMLEKMEQRRQWKNVNTDEGRKQYKKMNNELRRETDKAREQWMQKQCERIEELEKLCKIEEMYQVVKTITAKKTNVIKRQGMKNKNGIITSDLEENKKVWVEYIKELYDTNANERMDDVENQSECEENRIGQRIEISEVKKAIKELKNNKALGTDGIPSEALKTLDISAIFRITVLINKIYDTGIWPEDLLRTTLVPLPKKPNATECKDFRTISFICHLTKAITKIIMKRIERKIEDNMGDDQFGFRKGRGTRDAMACVRMLSEKMLEFNKELYVCFVDWEKAFDRVDWNILLKVLKDIDINWKDRRLIRELYKGQKVVVRVEDEETEEVVIGRGVRQGCCMSPVLFNLYAEKLMEEALEQSSGVSVGSEKIKSIKYADDQAVLAESEEDLQRMMENIHNAGIRYGMKINISKTKVMRMSKKVTEERMKVTLEGKYLEQVENFKYLGGMIYADGSCTKEIRSRIAMGKTAYTKVQDILTARRIPLKLRKRFAKCYIWSVVLYGSETWTMRKKEEKYLESFEMWLWRRIENIIWSDKVRNEEVLRRVGEERSILKTIKKRKRSWLGHILRRDCLQKRIMEGEIKGTRSRGAKKFGMLTDILENKTFEELKEEAQDRIRWRRDGGPDNITMNQRVV
uniref:Craniofacial development protein 2 n=2 Tax=Cacopsylla melanoneura TaxID=428564 RepID=A0A8D8WQA5_9HEMI